MFLTVLSMIRLRIGATLLVAVAVVAPVYVVSPRHPSSEYESRTNHKEKHQA